jgi:hypothetical protein
MTIIDRLLRACATGMRMRAYELSPCDAALSQRWPLILMQQHPQRRLIERKAPSQQAQQKDRFAKACPNARHVQGDVQQVHKEPRNGPSEKRISKSPAPPNGISKRRPPEGQGHALATSRSDRLSGQRLRPKVSITEGRLIPGVTGTICCSGARLLI